MNDDYLKLAKPCPWCGNRANKPVLGFSITEHQPVSCSSEIMVNDERDSGCPIAKFWFPLEVWNRRGMECRKPAYGIEREYVLKRRLHGTFMAEGARVDARSLAEAQEKAVKLFPEYDHKPSDFCERILR